MAVNTIPYWKSLSRVYMHYNRKPIEDTYISHTNNEQLVFMYPPT